LQTVENVVDTICSSDNVNLYSLKHRSSQGNAEFKSDGLDKLSLSMLHDCQRHIDVNENDDVEESKGRSRKVQCRKGEIALFSFRPSLVPALQPGIPPTLGSTFRSEPTEPAPAGWFFLSKQARKKKATSINASLRLEQPLFSSALSAKDQP
jgi:hypothetical protein